MNAYQVILISIADNKKSFVILKDYDEVVKLLQNLDTEGYRLGGVITINEPIFQDISSFVKKENNLEIGN
jgi:hypothetical protein